jgi:hypothetical protein
MKSTKKPDSSLATEKRQSGNEVEVDVWAKPIKWRSHWLRKSHEPLNAAINDCLEIVNNIDKTLANDNACYLSVCECALIYGLNKYTNLDERELFEDLNVMSKAVAGLVSEKGFLSERALVGFASLVLQRLWTLQPVISVFGLNEAEGIDTNLVATTVSAVYRSVTRQKRSQAGKTTGSKAHAKKRKGSAKLRKEVEVFANSLAKHDLDREAFDVRIRAKFASDIQNAGNISENTVLHWAKEAIKTKSG